LFCSEIAEITSGLEASISEIKAKSLVYLSISTPS